MEDREQKRVFDEWLAWHKGALFKVVHAYTFTSHDCDDLFQPCLEQTAIDHQ